ncbi:hypothetical protein EPUL_004709 [Erysiphe pulchra]|uniref:Endonuclease/exonuclease/phosphatase domain-containing protein n=1 Tax=Erysiphe pulchra TaxID=225359 RepID=A0A2S4PL20_9PEZI|nr:hypothetical protein EPUL_004709 [Erysiphe pulchra]
MPNPPLPTLPQIPYYPEQLNSQGIVENVPNSSEVNVQNDIEMRTPAGTFQPAGFGSFHSTHLHNVGNTTLLDQITRQVLLCELTRMYDALVQKIVMENGALMAILRAENKGIKQELEELCNKVCNTYLVARVPERLPEVEQATRNVGATEQEGTTQSPPKYSSSPDIPGQHTTPSLMATVAATNAPSAEKPAQWTTVNNKKGHKKPASNNDIPGPLKSVEEAKRRIIFLRSSEAPRPTGTIALDILYSFNMKLLSMKLPAHLRLEVTVNQQWIGLKVHTVEIGRYYPAGGLEQIRREVAAGPSAVEMPFVPRRIAHPERMKLITRNGTQLYSKIKVTLKTYVEAEPYIPVGLDTLCTVCCHWGHTTHGCPNPENVRCAICAETYLTTAHKCPVVGYKSPVGRYCKLHGSHKCANCGESHNVRATRCVDHRRAVAIAIAKSDRREWREQENRQEERNSSSQEDGDPFDEPDNNMELGDEIFNSQTEAMGEYYSMQTQENRDETTTTFQVDIEIGADMLCLQEPYIGSEGMNHLAYDFRFSNVGEHRQQRVALGVKKDLEGRLIVETRSYLIDHPYLQVVDVWELNTQRNKKRRTRIVKIYDNWVGRGQKDGRTVLAGDFNAHSTYWNPEYRRQERTEILEGLIDKYSLIINNDTLIPTRLKQTAGRSVTDLTFTTPVLGFVAAWTIDPEYATPSDHELITFDLENLDETFGSTGPSKEITG